MTRVSSISIARLTAVSVAIGAFIALGISNGQTVFAQAAGGKSNLSNAQLTALVRDPSVGSRALSVTVVGSGPLVTVLAEEREAAQDKDLKIDAMFLSRTLIEGAPGQIDKVKVLFSQTGKPARHITISRGEINDFSAGRISAATLLQSLTLVAVHAENMPEITDGPEVERRLLAWKRIDKLRSQGTGVSPFEAIFKEIQGLAKANDAEKVSQRLTYLESKLTGQEEQVKQAKDSLRGRGVPAVKTASTAGAGAGAATPSGHSGAPAQSAASGYIPPEADHLRSTFNAQSSEIISQVTRKNSAEGFKLRDLKAEIEKAFASHQDAKAFEMLHNFDLMATKILGTSAFGPGGQGGQGGGMGGGMNPGGGPPGGGPPGGGPPGGGPPF